MVERLIFSAVLTLIGVLAFSGLRYWHMRRASRVLSQTPLSTGQPTLLYFRSDHCAPCITQAQFIEKLQGDYQRLSIRQVDVDREPDLAAQYSVFTLPSTLIIDDGGEVQHINYGLTGPAKLARQLENVL
jgi:thioredoxin 1